MKKSALLSILLRSFTIQASFNFHTMQALGFAYALLPLTDRQGDEQGKKAEWLHRHLQRFNTHPFLVSPLIGSMVQLEEAGDPQAAEQLKKALMGPYAAIGDVFFWGALRTFASVIAVLLALQGLWMAPLALLLLWTPFQLWVRARGFFAGFLGGQGGVDFIRKLNLPALAGRIRWVSLLPMGVLGVMAAERVGHPWHALPGMLSALVGLSLVLLFYLGIRKGVSQVQILYGMTLVCMMIAL